MISEKQEDLGFTPIPHEVIEALYKVNLSPYESRIVLFLIRKTLGWHKESDHISLSQFSSEIGIDRRLIHRTLKTLLAKNMIVIKKDNTRPVYSFQKDSAKWQSSSPRKTKQTVICKDDKVSSPAMIGVISTDDKVSSPEILTKNIYTSTKDIKKDKALFDLSTPEIAKAKPLVLPNDINPEIWRAFVNMRKKKRAPLTDEACHLILIELNKIGQNKNDVLEQSIRNSWSDVYQIHGGNNGPGKYQRTGSNKPANARTYSRAGTTESPPKTSTTRCQSISQNGEWPCDYREVALG